MCEINDPLRTKIKQRYPGMPTFGDIMGIKEHELPDFSILGASPPCQDFSTMGMARGPYGNHSTSFPMITKIMEW
jgi:site-specific DNA-cytosine methylase